MNEHPLQGRMLTEAPLPSGNTLPVRLAAAQQMAVEAFIQNGQVAPMGILHVHNAEHADLGGADVDLDVTIDLSFPPAQHARRQTIVTGIAYNLALLHGTRWGKIRNLMLVQESWAVDVPRHEYERWLREYELGRIRIQDLPGAFEQLNVTVWQEGGQIEQWSARITRAADPTLAVLGQWESTTNIQPTMVNKFLMGYQMGLMDARARAEKALRQHLHDSRN